MERKAIIDIYAKSKKWKLYLEEVKKYTDFLSTQSNYPAIEELYLDILRNENLESEIRFEHGAKVYAISKFHNPKCDIFKVFQ